MPGRLTPVRSGWRLDISPPPPTAGDLRDAFAQVAAAGGGELQWWQSRPDGWTDAVAAHAGLVFWRDVLQLHRSLPLDRGEADDLPVRPFVIGEDEEAWLAVNNRSFAWHPEQSGWDRSDLSARFEEPWFDPAGFLLYSVDEELRGFCWTKVHPHGVGEIYVIGVDPDWGGKGLGRRLTVAGLSFLAGRGCTEGMLYVEATNAPALAMYDHLGFTVDHVDRAYRAMVARA